LSERYATINTLDFQYIDLFISSHHYEQLTIVKGVEE